MTESNRLSANRSRLELLVLAGAEAAGHLLDAQLLELDGIDRAGDDEVVAQRDAVPVLLGGPAVDPEAPRAVHAEVHRDLAVVGRQVVLGQQVVIIAAWATSDSLDCSGSQSWPPRA